MPLSGHDVAIDLSVPPVLHVAGRGLFRGGAVGRYRLPSLWCLHLYSYHASLKVAGRAIAIKPGMLTLIPPDQPLVYRYATRSEHLFTHFAAEVVDAGAVGADGAVSLPIAQMLGRDAATFRRRLEHIVETQAVQPGHARALFWSLLWELAGRQTHEQSADALPAVVADAVGYIDTNLHHPLRVADIAKHLGLSHNQLTRLFRQHLGSTVVAYLRTRRMHRAHHLLAHTSQRVGEIACEVGLPDAQQFNKTFRRHHGESPTALRGRLNQPKP